MDKLIFDKGLFSGISFTAFQSKQVDINTFSLDVNFNKRLNKKEVIELKKWLIKVLK